MISCKKKLTHRNRRAAFEIRLAQQTANAKGFAKAYLFFSICLGKINVKAIEFLGILKKYFSKNKKKKILFKIRDVLLNKKRYFYFSHNFQTFMMQIIYWSIHRFLVSLFILLLFSYTMF